MPSPRCPPSTSRAIVRAVGTLDKVVERLAPVALNTRKRVLDYKRIAGRALRHGSSRHQSGSKGSGKPRSKQ